MWMVWKYIRKEEKKMQPRVVSRILVEILDYGTHQVRKTVREVDGKVDILEEPIMI